MFTSTDRKRWELQSPFQTGKEINHAVFDSRSGKLHATANDPWFGSQLAWSADWGRTWQAPEHGPGFPAESGLKLERIWHLEPAQGSNHTLYAGVAPAALFRSDDDGRTWLAVDGLNQHSTRPRWQPGGGGLCLHSIAIDPAQPQRMWAAVSAAGTFRTEDGGQTWQPLNRGVRAEFMPDKFPEVGQCVHKLLLAPGKSSLLFQQNHCGVYRSETGGETWQEITAGLPSDFGFPLAIHPREAETIYVIPLKGAEFRCPPDGKLRVFRSRNGGSAWKPLSKGLPQENVFLDVYRAGMDTDELDPAGVYFGTNTGKIFASRDEGDSWYLLADNLPPIFSVTVTAL